ncbi:MAG: SRPBCC family protein [Candidatus Woesearchaeota archaeon]
MKKLTQTITFKATPHEVFELIMDSKKHSAFTGEKAVTSRKVGGKFKAYGKYISGENLEIIKDKRIVQIWRASDWPRGIYSKVSFEFEKSGKNTKLKFSQEGVPESQYAEIKEGWSDFYWGPMKKFLEKKRKKGLIAFLSAKL